MATKENVVVKVTREGVVMVNGENVGYVKKEIRQGLFATAMGISVSGGGTPYYIPFAADGTQLNEYGYDTRKRAVKRITDHAQPLTVSDVKAEDGWHGKYVSAVVKKSGYYFAVSRYPQESAWVIDALFTPESMMPTFSNGSGTRVTSARVLADAVADIVTQAATDAGVWPMA